MLKTYKQDFFSFLSLFTVKGLQSVLHSLRTSFITQLGVILTSMTVIVLFLGIILVVSVKSGVEPSDLTRDLGGVLHLEPFIGCISYLGFFFWFGALTLSFLAFKLFKMDAGLSHKSPMYGLACWITLLLSLDDVYQLHEIIFPITLGIPENTFYIVYLFLTATFLIRFHRLLMGDYFALIAIAYALFAASIAFDMLVEGQIAFSTYIEDALKLSGIITWFLFFWFSVTKDFKSVMSHRNK